MIVKYTIFFGLGNLVKHLHLTAINHVLSAGSVMLNMNNWIVMLVIFVILSRNINVT